MPRGRRKREQGGQAMNVRVASYFGPLFRTRTERISTNARRSAGLLFLLFAVSLGSVLSEDGVRIRDEPRTYRVSMEATVGVAGKRPDTLVMILPRPETGEYQEIREIRHNMGKILQYPETGGEIFARRFDWRRRASSPAAVQGNATFPHDDVCRANGFFQNNAPASIPKKHPFVPALHRNGRGLRQPKSSRNTKAPGVSPRTRKTIWSTREKLMSMSRKTSNSSKPAVLPRLTRFSATAGGNVAISLLFSSLCCGPEGCRRSTSGA